MIKYNIIGTTNHGSKLQKLVKRQDFTVRNCQIVNEQIKDVESEIKRLRELERTLSDARKMYNEEHSNLTGLIALASLDEGVNVESVKVEL